MMTVELTLFEIKMMAQMTATKMQQEISAASIQVKRSGDIFRLRDAFQIAPLAELGNKLLDALDSPRLD